MSRARAIDPDFAVGPAIEPAPFRLGAPIIFRAADGQDRAAIITSFTPESVNAVVFGKDHDDSEAGLKVGLVRKGDHWITG